MSMKANDRDWTKTDLHIHTLDDPKDAVDCFDAIELCHFHKGLFNLNRRAEKVAARFGKPLIATSDAHRLHAFGSHYTSIPMPPELTVENVFAALRVGPLSLTSPPCRFADLVSTVYFLFLAHPFRRRRRRRHNVKVFSTPKHASVFDRTH